MDGRVLLALCLLFAATLHCVEAQDEGGDEGKEEDPERAHPDKPRGNRRPRWLPAITPRLLELLNIHEDNGSYALPQLGYSYGGLEPFMSERTVRVHHTGHHATYTGRMNSILAHMTTDAERNPLEHLMHLEDLIEDFRGLFRNQAGGFFNHAITFFVMGPIDQSKDVEEHGPTGKVYELIEDTFGSSDILIERFSSTATQVFGSGYVWLCLGNKLGSRKLHIAHSANQDTPLIDGYRPILGIDLWEHAYYLQYQNQRTDYITTWWQLVNWENVNRLLDTWIDAESHAEPAMESPAGGTEKDEL